MTGGHLQVNKDRGCAETAVDSGCAETAVDSLNLVTPDLHRSPRKSELPYTALLIEHSVECSCSKYLAIYELFAYVPLFSSTYIRTPYANSSLFTHAPLSATATEHFEHEFVYYLFI